MNPREHPMFVMARMAEESKHNDPELHELVAAVREGDAAKVKRLLGKGLSPNELPPNGSDTAVWAAMYARKPDMIRVLGEAGADLNAGYPDTPLEVAATWGHVELIRALVAGGAHVDQPTESGQTPLRAALSKGNAEAAIELIKCGADPTFAPPCARYPGNATPLEIAAYGMGGPVLDAMLAALGDRKVERLDTVLLCGAASRGDVAEIKQRLASGADINASNRSRQTPLCSAADAGLAKAVKYLLSAGATPKGTGPQSPLVAAALSGKLAIVKMLVEAGADDFDEALRFAKNARHKKVVEYLLSVSSVKAASERPTGVATFDVNDSCLLIAAPVEKASAALQKLLGAKTRTPNVLGKRIKLAKRCYAVFRIVGQPWSIVMRLCSHWADTFHGSSDAAALSKSLSTRVILVNSGDTAGIGQYFTCDKGKLVEVFDTGSGESLDLGGLKQVARRDHITFASSVRKPDLKKVKNPLDFIHDHLKRENAFVPFGHEELGNPGQTVELTLEDLGPDDVERLDYVAA